ncbi:MAG: cellulase family glycosylhydrolase [Solirubrobacteraceae bacterium]|jgi:endoglycosylceramidase
MACCGVARGAAELPLSHAGRWIIDAQGRVVIVHGVNMVDKVAPYEPQAAGFGDRDGALLARLGFNAVRVGVIWKALEPLPGVFDGRYLDSIAGTVAMLARHGIVSLLDFHQDMLNERFQGEGFPDWAIEDNGLPALPRNGFPLNYETMPALQRAFDHFWANSPGPGGVGLQDRFAAAWRVVARRFAGDPAVLGDELFNEPFPGTGYTACGSPAGCPAFDARLTRFDRRVTRAIRTVDRRTLVFAEPNVLFDFGAVTHLGALDDPEAGFAFHDYCLSTGPDGCPSERTAMDHALAHVARTHEALLLTEFGSTPFAGDLSGMVARADAGMVPWLEWSFCPCEDPTGASPDPIVRDPHQPLVGANLGALALHTLVEPYPQVIAGTPRAWRFDRAGRVFALRYSTSRAGRRGRFAAGSVTEIATPSLTYGGRYAVTVRGGAVLSRRGAAVLRIAACSRAHAVSVTVRPRGADHESCRPPRR